MIILASASPRRKELLRLITDEEFIILPSDSEAETDNASSPQAAVERVALLKAQDIFCKNPEATVIGADTSVYFEGKHLGKPKDEEEAFLMLRSLSGKTHHVITAVAVLSEKKKTVFSETAEVTFNELDDGEIREYIKSREPMDKAGAYGIQGKGACFIKGIKGDYYTVMGLPVSRLYNVLKDF